MMIFLNDIREEEYESVAGWTKTTSIQKPEAEKFIKILHPFAPHMAQELWSELGNKTFLDFEPWPEYDPTLITEDIFTLVIQVNGKARGTVTASVDITEEKARSLALAEERIQKFLDGKEPKRVIYVPGRLINIVV